MKRQLAEGHVESTDSEKNAKHNPNSTVDLFLMQIQNVIVLDKLVTTALSTRLIDTDKPLEEFLIAKLHQKSFALKNQQMLITNNASKDNKAFANLFAKRKADWNATTNLMDHATKSPMLLALQNGRKTTADIELKSNVVRMKIA
jgi:hypothetical protein